VAYGPAEAVRQVPSFVLNTQTYLALSVGPPSGPPRLTKVVYEHFGYSNLLMTVQDGRTRSLLLNREPSCDESLESYIRSSPKLFATGAESDLVESQSAPIRYLNSFDPSTVPGTTPLPCFVLKNIEASGAAVR